MAKLRQHHEECFNHHKIAEEERNAKERQHTMNLLKRAQLVQQLAQLDTLVSNILEHLAEITLCAQPLFIMFITRGLIANLAKLDILCVFY